MRLNRNTTVKPKKHLGQHFLIDLKIAEKIVSSLQARNSQTIVEIGPGMGVLSDFLVDNDSFESKQIVLLELDRESVVFLNSKKKFNTSHISILEGDVLKLDFDQWKAPIAIIGNLPYNISSPIFFKILEALPLAEEAVFMIQKEVADRICSKHATKVFGILSVLIQTYYEVELVMDVPPTAFNPPPKVMSSVIRLKLKPDAIDKLYLYSILKTIVKKSFNQRRKMLRNTLKTELELIGEESEKFLTLRPEQLSVKEFNQIAEIILKANHAV